MDVCIKADYIDAFKSPLEAETEENYAEENLTLITVTNHHKNNLMFIISPDNLKLK